MPLTIALGISLAGVQPVPTSGGGGGGDPTPLVSSDFKNGTYSIGGVSKTLGEVWEENATFAGYSASDIQAAVGYTKTVSNSDFVGGPVLTAEAFAALGSGFVAVVDFAYTWNLVQYNLAQFDFMFIELPTAATGWSTGIGDVYQDDASDYAYVQDISTFGTGNLTVPGVGTHRVAFLFSESGLAASLNGGANATVADPDPSGATAFGAKLHAYAEVGGAVTATIEKIEFFSLTDYDASDLPTLSAP